MSKKWNKYCVPTFIFVKLSRPIFFIFRRAKEKRLKKDAGRARWGQYFRGLQPTSSSEGGASPGPESGVPRSGANAGDSDHDSDVDLEFNQREFIMS